MIYDMMMMKTVNEVSHEHENVNENTILITLLLSSLQSCVEINTYLKVNLVAFNMMSLYLCTVNFEVCFQGDTCYGCS